MAGASYIDGDGYDNVLNGTGGVDRMRGHDGNDELAGNGGNDRILGGAGDDIIDGGADDDSLVGQSGADIFVFESGHGNDTIVDFRNGEDRIDLSALGITGFDGVAAADTGGGVTLDLAAHGGGTVFLRRFDLDKLDAADFVFAEVEEEAEDEGSQNEPPPDGGGNLRLDGGGGNDELFGWDENDEFHGGGGNDHLQGGDGDDVLYGGGGDDRLIGQAGADTFVIGAGGGTDTIDFTVGADAIDLSALGVSGLGDLTVTEGDLYDTSTQIDLSAHNGGTLILESVAPGELSASDFVFVGTNRVEGTAGGDVSRGTRGNDLINGGAGNDKLNGRAGVDILRGGEGDDRLFGAGGDDTLHGGTGDDSLWGGKGSDRLNGGAGDDWLRGDKGADTFVFYYGHGNDVIDDFTDGEDLLDLRHVGPGSFSDISATQDGSAVRIDLSAYHFGGVIRLENFDIADLDAGDFLF